MNVSFNNSLKVEKDKSSNAIMPITDPEVFRNIENSAALKLEEPSKPLSETKKSALLPYLKLGVNCIGYLTAGLLWIGFAVSLLLSMPFIAVGGVLGVAVGAGWAFLTRGNVCEKVIKGCRVGALIGGIVPLVLGFSAIAILMKINGHDNVWGRLLKNDLKEKVKIPVLTENDFQDTKPPISYPPNVVVWD